MVHRSNLTDSSNVTGTVLVHVSTTGGVLFEYCTSKSYCLQFLPLRVAISHRFRNNWKSINIGRFYVVCFKVVPPSYPQFEINTDNTQEITFLNSVDLLNFLPSAIQYESKSFAEVMFSVM